MQNVPVNAWAFVDHVAEILRTDGVEFLSDAQVAILHDNHALRTAVDRVVADPSSLGGIDADGNAMGDA